MNTELNNMSLSDDLETVIEALNRLNDGLHYWSGEAEVADLRNKLTDASLKAFLIQEKLPTNTHFDEFHNLEDK